MRRLLLVLPALFVFATNSDAQVLKGDELKAALVGKPCTFTSPDGKISGTIFYGTDGRSQVKGNFPGFTEDTGTWRFKGDTFCAKWKKIRNGVERCENPKRLPDGRLDFGNAIMKFN